MLHAFNAHTAGVQAAKQQKWWVQAARQSGPQHNAGNRYIGLPAGTPNSAQLLAAQPTKTDRPTFSTMQATAGSASQRRYTSNSASTMPVVRALRARGRFRVAMPVDPCTSLSTCAQLGREAGEGRVQLAESVGDASPPLHLAQDLRTEASMRHVERVLPMTASAAEGWPGSLRAGWPLQRQRDKTPVPPCAPLVLPPACSWRPPLERVALLLAAPPPLPLQVQLLLCWALPAAPLCVP